MQYRLIPLLICLLPLAPNLCAQTGQTERTPSTGSITLTVTDLTGGIVPNAEVDIDPSPKGLPNLKTNKDGMLSLDEPKQPGEYLDASDCVQPASAGSNVWRDQPQTGSRDPQPPWS